MRIAVIDGQGGKIGKAIVEKFRKAFEDRIEIVVLGTNSIATSIMLKAGANEGATGENAIVYGASNADIILGSIEIVCSNSLLGELTPLMARSIAESPAKKILIPLNRLNITFTGIEKKALPRYIDDAIEMVEALGGQVNHVKHVKPPKRQL
ncbi:MAG TPA: hypothetical protein DCK76_04010 [Desulfotomaculum sp.]|nr:MAG: hypothetical protein XD84_0625 [Desulfotomaculum sp. 46_80]KUK85296.1 MAG: hypothetical protein XE00_0008 [Desulfofundulus kuznetsovii]HAG10550.1 hypothetical protein [Desulfotomaculum sp.]HBY03442.1 hypothetical protein [Desulfotomaculum sp.]